MKEESGVECLIEMTGKKTNENIENIKNSETFSYTRIKLESTKCELAILCSDSDNEVQGPEVKILS